MKRYRALIKKAREYYESGLPEFRNLYSGSELFDLEWCPGLTNEINLWTYWQGGTTERYNRRRNISCGAGFWLI